MSFCQKCGNQIEGNFCTRCGTPAVINTQPTKVEMHSTGLTCPHCGSHNVFAQAVSTQKKRGCFAVTMWIILAICTCGLILLIPLLIKKGSKVNTFVVCQNCGYRWRK